MGKAGTPRVPICAWYLGLRGLPRILLEGQGNLPSTGLTHSSTHKYGFSRFSFLTLFTWSHAPPDSKGKQVALRISDLNLQNTVFFVPVPISFCQIHPRLHIRCLLDQYGNICYALLGSHTRKLQCGHLRLAPASAFPLPVEKH